MTSNFYQQIEKEFDKEWPQLKNPDTIGIELNKEREKIKSFLRSALERQAREIIEEIEKVYNKAEDINFKGGLIQTQNIIREKFL